MIELKNIVKSYETGIEEADGQVLKDITLSVSSGESLAIVGPSGSGKSTLLNIIGALDRPTSGSVEVGGQDLLGLDERALAGFRNKQIGFIFQLHHLLPQLTVLENVLVPTLATKSATAKDAQGRALSLLERVGLLDRANYLPSQLSGGQRQRVAVVRALINEPKLLLADEPTGSLDAKSADSIGKLLVELKNDENVTLVVVTHSMKLAEQMDRVMELADGRLS